MTENEVTNMLNLLRNTWGHGEPQLRQSRHDAANEIERMRAEIAALRADAERWRTVSWVVREVGSTTPMMSFEMSQGEAEATKERWAADGYEGEVIRLCERVAAHKEQSA